jgi:hypothetical protein
MKWLQFGDKFFKMGLVCLTFTKRYLDRARKKRRREMNPNKTALFLIPAIPVGAIGGIMAMSGLGFGGTFGFIYSVFIFIYVIAYTQGSNDSRTFIEANTDKKSAYATWTEMQKLDAIQDLLLQVKSQKGSVADVIPENVSAMIKTVSRMTDGKKR